MATKHALLFVVLAASLSGLMFGADSDARNQAFGRGTASPTRITILATPTPSGITAFYTTAQTSNLDGVSTDTGSKIWAHYGSTFTVNSSHALGCTSAGLLNLAYIDAGQANPSVVTMRVAALPTPGTDFGFLLRGFNNGNQFIAYWSGVDRWALVRTDADVGTLVQLSGGSQTYAVDDTITAVVTSTAIQMYHYTAATGQTAIVIDYTSSTYNTGTYVGWYMGIFNGGDSGGTGRFDQFGVSF